MAVRVTDRHPAIAIKDACLARSGVYEYSYDEMIARGYTPAIKKPYYTEYRPAEVIERCKDKFGLTAVTVEHTLDETHEGNFHDQAVGVIGDNLVIKRMPGGDEIGIFGKMAFYTKDGYEYYRSGGKETSADYRSIIKPDATGKYDFVLQDILSVNGVVITQRGRGGADVRVMDAGRNIFGGINMAGRKGVLSFLNVGRSKDASFKMSKVVFDGIKTLHTLDAAGKEKLAGDIMAHVTDLSDGKNKELLIGAVKDSLMNPTDAAKQEEQVSRVIDGLYQACVDNAADVSQEDLAAMAEGKTKDAVKADGGKVDAGKETKDGDDSEDGKETKDSMDAIIDKAVAKTAETVLSKVTDSIGDMIDKKVAEVLGVKTEAKDGKKKDDGRTEDSADVITREEGAFLLDSAFNS